ncbi:hypothetical protein VaNZ11_008741 [Volvox africanus]|uniref:Uncharacterized protein n=1 Tax=Volvox africanus TaxID=51714 RepID=A0ABQ5S728_9CHLO|nr:hypothetical protein VaNZ11_008741 [Volvox africanus]
MLSFGSGGSVQAGTYIAQSTSQCAVGSNNSWVQSQHSIPLPPHHRPRYQPASAAVGSASAQAFSELIGLSPQIVAFPTRQPLMGAASFVPVRQVTSRNIVVPQRCGPGRSLFRPEQCTPAASRVTRTTAEPVATCQPSPPTSPPLENSGNSLIDTDFAAERANGEVLPHNCPSVPSLTDQPSRDGVVKGIGLAHDGQSCTAGRPSDRTGDRINVSCAGQGSAQVRGRKGEFLNTPHITSALEADKMPAEQGPERLPGGPNKHNQVSHSRNMEKQHLGRQAHQYGLKRQQGQFSWKQQTPAKGVTAAQLKPSARAPGLRTSNQAADKALVVAILRCSSWTHLRELLRSHQEQHLETLRLAAAAAAAAAHSTTVTPKSSDPLRNADSCTALVSEGPLAAEAEPGQPQHVAPMQLASVFDGFRLDSSSHAGDMNAAESTKTHPPQRLVQQLPHAQHQHPPQPAFTPRHLATALHVIAERVSEPRALSHADRVQLGEFLRALGRACASLQQPFPPVDLTMTLRALARLLGDSVTLPSMSAAAVASPGGNQRWAEPYGSSRGVVHSEESIGRRLTGRIGTRTLTDEHHTDDEGVSGDAEWDSDDAPGRASRSSNVVAGGEETGNRGGATKGAGAGREADLLLSPRRGPLHATWLNETWVNKLLQPTVERSLEHFEPRHVSGVLWALATLGIQPLPELLDALCGRAADCARVNIVMARGLTPGTATVNHHNDARAPTDSRRAMTPQGLSLTLWALARLGFQPSQSCLEVLLGACEADMLASVASAPGPSDARAVVQVLVPPCCSLDLAQRVWALASLGCHPGEDWLELLVTAFLVRASVEQVSGQSCSMMMWALARLQDLSPSAHQWPQPGAASSASSTGAGSDLAGQASSGVRDAVVGDPISAADGESGEEASQEMLRARVESSRGASTSGRNGTVMSSSRASAAVYLAEAYLAGAEGDLEAWVSSGGASGDGSMPFMNGQDLTDKASSAPSPAGAAVLRRPGRVAALLTLLQGSLGKMSSQHLATVLWALSSLDVRPSQAWLAAFLEAAGQRLTAALLESQPFGPQSLAMMVGALARLRYRPPSAWMVRFMEVCRKELPLFGPHSVCVLAWSLVRLSYKPRGNWRRDFAARTQRLLPDMDPLGLCLLMWSLASWRSCPPLPWIQAALAVSAGHLRTANQAWGRSAAALEVQTLAAADGSSVAAHPFGGPLPSTAVLQPNLLAVMLWSMSHLLQRPPPPFWLSLANSATAAALQYSRAVAARNRRIGPSDACTDDPDALGRHAAVPLDPRTLAMLLQGWARLGRPPVEDALVVAMSYIAEVATEALTSSNGSRRLRQDAKRMIPWVNSFTDDVADIGPQHVAIVLWSCAVMGLEPPQDLVERLAMLHTDLLLLQSKQFGLSPAAGGDAIASTEYAPLPSTGTVTQNGGSKGNLQESASPVNQVAADRDGAAGVAEDKAKKAGGQERPADTEHGTDSIQRLRHLLLARELLTRQPELGMLVWALMRFGVRNPPEWLPAVLVAVGCTLEEDAAAATAPATAAGGGPEGTAVAGMAPRPDPRVVTLETGQGRTTLSPQTSTQLQQDLVSVAASLPPSTIALLTVKTLARACLVWRVRPGDRWITAASACLEAGVLGTKLQRAYGRANLEAEVRYLLEQLQVAEDAAGASGKGVGSAAARQQHDAVAAAWATAAEAAGGAVLTNAMAAVAAGSAAAWMQGLVW